MIPFRTSIALLAGLGALFLVPATAEAAFFQEYIDGNCSANAGCNVDFPVVPAGKTLTVTNASCYLRFPTSGSLLAAQYVIFNVTSGKRIVAITQAMHSQSVVKTAVGSESVYVSDDQILALGKPGQRFRAYALVNKDSDGSPGTISQLSCHITGTLE